MGEYVSSINARNVLFTLRAVRIFTESHAFAWDILQVLQQISHFSTMCADIILYAYSLFSNEVMLCYEFSADKTSSLW